LQSWPKQSVFLCVSSCTSWITAFPKFNPSTITSILCENQGQFFTNDLPEYRFSGKLTKQVQLFLTFSNREDLMVSQEERQTAVYVEIYSREETGGMPLA
jgi:hypothetical protein